MNSPFYKTGGFPEIKEKNKGKFTAWAKKNGFEDACSAASSVMSKKDKYSEEVVKMVKQKVNHQKQSRKKVLRSLDKILIFPIKWKVLEN